MQINQMEDVMLQGMRPNVPRDEAEATAIRYDYPGKEELHRFYDSCLEAGKKRNPIETIERATIPVGLIIFFGLCFGGVALEVIWRIQSPMSKIGILCFFVMILLKAVLMNRVHVIRHTKSNIDFEALHAYESRYMRHGFTGGRRFPYCLMGDTQAQYIKEKKGVPTNVCVPILVASIFVALFIVYITTQNNKAVADVAYELVIGTGFTLIGLLLGLWTLIRPWVKMLLYRRKIMAVCVDVEEYARTGSSSSVHCNVRIVALFCKNWYTY